MANKANGNGTGTPAAIRCAIYTRKSTDEGLNQDFNSLDAQRDAGAAYVPAKPARAGTFYPTITTTAGSPAPTWIDPRCAACWPTYRRRRSIASLSTKWTG